MGKSKKTCEEFVREVQDIFHGNIVVLGRYIDRKTKIEFYCKTCGNKWYTTPMSILKTIVGCPECAKKLISEKNIIRKNSDRFVDSYPELAKRFDDEKNKNIDIKILSSHSGKRIWWKCDVCGHSWQSNVASVVDNKGNCPKCYLKNATNNVIAYRLNKNGSLADRYPELLNEWDYSKNIDFDPNKMLAKSNKKVWWKCQKCGREWQAKIAKRTAGEGCPHCYRFEKSNLQQKVQHHIEDTYTYKFTHEHDCSLKCRNPNTSRLLPYDNELIVADNIRLIIECHGEQHYKVCGLTKLTAKKENITPEDALKYVQWKDEYKKQYALSKGYYYLAIPYWTEQDDSYKTLIDNKIQEILNNTKLTCA